jgi:hypothetical protein
VASRAEATGFQSGAAWTAVTRKRRRKKRRSIWGGKIPTSAEREIVQEVGAKGVGCKICVCNV